MTTLHDRKGTAPSARRRGGRLALLLLLSALALAPAAHAARMIGGDDTGGDTGDDTGGGEPTIPYCLAELAGSLQATPATVPLGGSTTLTWTAAVPSGCSSSLQFSLNGENVGPSGVRTVTPQANATYRLRGTLVGVGSAEIAIRVVTVQLPPDPMFPGRQLVSITSSSQVPLFIQAIGTPNTTVTVANQVQLDLTSKAFLPVAAGVVLRGGRAGLEPGPRLFTTTRPGALFSVVGDAVRVTGVRIQGPDMGVPDRHGNRGIHVVGRRAVEIDHNEISGFSGMGIQVWDADGAGVMHPWPPYQVYIHDNYIHHNEAIGGDGYGVAVGQGAYVLIERNTFEWNRHAIEGDGSPGTGYVATANLVLEQGGYHRWIPFPGFWIHTHQFDMHGMDDCLPCDAFTDACGNCGPAGHSMYIRQNTFFYGADEAIYLRGTPQVGMFVGQNVFANHLRFSDATSQKETGLVEEPGNVYGYNGKLQLGSCDLDGDGVEDAFMATGVTWWYSSGGTAPWAYLNTSPVRLPDLQLGYFDWDTRCDVKVGAAVFSGGRSDWSPFGGGGGIGGGGVLGQ